MENKITQNSSSVCYVVHEIQPFEMYLPLISSHFEFACLCARARGAAEQMPPKMYSLQYAIQLAS